MARLSSEALRRRLEARQFEDLFVEDLGWDRLRGVADVTLTVEGASVRLEGLVQKLNVPVMVHRTARGLPDRRDRRRVEGALSKRMPEHLVIFLDEATGAQVWQWVKREPGQPDRVREHAWRPRDAVEALRQKLDGLQFSLEEEESGRLTVAAVTGRLKRAFDADPVTKRFYADFKSQHDALLAFLKGLPDAGLKSWYASVILNRLMFVYFVQKKGFIDCGDTDYLRTKLVHSKVTRGKDQFYKAVLGPLFFRGFACPPAERTAAERALLGEVPYLNGGLFQPHQIELAHGEQITIPDKTFEGLFAFFDKWRWHLDERAAAAEVSGKNAADARVSQESEINPDVLGYIFEKYVNQKQMGAYYTKEDITGYICGNTILPRLLDKVRVSAKVAFEGDGSVWRLLAEDPDRYIWPAIQRGLALLLPEEVAKGLGDVAERGSWDISAKEPFALPTETWREAIHRRARFEELRASLRAGDIASPDAMVSANLDIRQFAQDAVAQADPTQLKAWWEALNSLTVLDPACGSGAFLFAALKILEPLYDSVLDRMAVLLQDAARAEAAGLKIAPGTVLSFCRNVLDDVSRHGGNQAYFILRCITLNNLYGVDLMEEAVEICKLRLFLKLVAQLDDPTKIEPLPDLDFNIRSGNSLVGVIADDDFDRVRQQPLDFGAIRLDIRERGEKAAMFFDQFRNMQMDDDTEQPEFRRVKADLQVSLREAADSSSRWIARQYGATTDQKQAYERWLRSHDPFNWWTEFMGVMRAGGFDAVVGNPPYVARTKVGYRPATLDEPLLSDIYGNFLLRTLRLKAPDGRCGLIVPLSLTFSEDFKVLRDALNTQGSNWLSSYDNIPAALFSGVSQRCTIWVHAPREGGTHTSPMYRWRAEFRESLMETITYHRLNHAWPSSFGIPKLRDAPQEQVLSILATNCGVRPDRVFGARTSKHSLGFATAARNFISVFNGLPPELHAKTLAPITKTKAATVPVATHSVARAALAITAGEGFFWYWLVRGDGFDVTGWIVRAYLGALGAVDQSTVEILAEIGELIHERRFEFLVFKKNGGKYVGNYNYGSAVGMRRAADELFLSALGITVPDREAVYDHVRRVLAINESAGEKGIPAAVKARFPRKPVDGRRERGLLQRARTRVSQLDAEAT